MEIIKEPIKRAELVKMAENGFGDLVKAVVDIRQEIMAIGGEMHADEEVLLVEQAESKREDVWGINIYPKRKPNEWIEFDSMINLKPTYGNRSRDVEDKDTRAKIAQIISKLIID